MTGSVSTNVIKDGNGTAIAGGVRMFDLSGTGAGPFVPMSVASDLTGAAVDLTLPAQVYGPGADGAAAVGGPILIGGLGVAGISQGVAMAGALAEGGTMRALGVANAVMDASGIWHRQRGSALGGNAFAVPVADVEGGATTARINSAASTNATLLKTGLSKLINVSVENVAAYPVYVKFYNKATAPTPGTDASVWVVGCVASGMRDIALPVGLNFPLGIGYAIVKGIAEADATAVLANDCIVNIGYK